jgi:putative transposase
MLVGDVEIRLKELLYEKAEEIDVQIAKLEIMPDHIRAFVKTWPINAPHYIVRQLKSYTARVLRLEFPHLLKMPSLWTRSYYCESVGHISEKTIMKYIEEQKNK